MSEPYMSEVRIFGFNFAPKGWATCDGQLLAINQNQALFSLLGVTFGGNGTTNFALPDLRGRVPVNFGGSLALGAKAGEEQHVLNINEIPSHQHQAFGSGAGATASTPANDFWTSGTGFTPYGNSTDINMSAEAVGNTGTNTPHENRSPYLVVNMCIALQGIYPSRN